MTRAVLCLPLILAALLMAPASARAGDVAACGVPDSVRMNTEDAPDYCDLHQRRLAYRTEAMALSADLNARRAAYEAPHIQAMNQYKADLEALNAQRGGAAAPAADEPPAPEDTAAMSAEDELKAAQTQP